MAGDLNMMAISAPPKQMAEAATHFEATGQEEKAVTLYVKSGQVSPFSPLLSPLPLPSSIYSFSLPATHLNHPPPPNTHTA